MTTLAIRRATSTDVEFVSNSWRTNYQMSHNAGPLPLRPLIDPHECACGRHVIVDRSYWPTMGAVLAELLKRPGIEILVAAKPGEHPPDDIYGWLVIERGVWAPMRTRVEGRWTKDELEPLEQPLVHYIFVKQGFREHGVARRLFAAAGLDRGGTLFYSFSTATAAKLAKHRKPDGQPLLADARFDPRLARFPKTNPQE